MNHLLKDEEFPQLSSIKPTRLNNTAWSKPIDPDMLKNTTPDPQQEIVHVLNQRPKESNYDYFHRVRELYLKTTRPNNYHVYTVINESHNLKVAARGEIIARFLCQLAEYKVGINDRKKQIINRREYIQDFLYDDEDLYEEVMHVVNYNTHKTNKAIDIYCNKSLKSIPISFTWFSDKVICTKTDDVRFSEEKIL